MSEETLAFVVEYGPFRAHALNADTWTVRDRTGYDHANCDDEDTARALAESLNALRRSK